MSALDVALERVDAIHDRWCVARDRAFAKNPATWIKWAWIGAGFQAVSQACSLPRAIKLFDDSLR